jgi:hypothetical protein
VFNVPAITIEAWFYLTKFEDVGYPLVMKHIDLNPGGFELHMTHDREFRWLIKDYWMNSSYALSVNKWHHIAVTSNGVDEICVYVDGNKIKCQEGGPLEYNNKSVTIGYIDRSDGDRYFPGYIQHLRISNIARTNFSYAKIDTVPSVEAGTVITPPGADTPDLALLDLTSYPNPEGGLLIKAVVENLGEAHTLNGFYTDLYVDHLPTGGGDYTGSIQFWVNDPIAPGATVTLTTVMDDFSALSVALHQPLAPSGEINATLYAQTDSAGAVTEPDDANNISAGIPVCLAAPDLYEGDDSSAGASLIAEGQSQSHNFDHPDDQDWLKFTAHAGVTYTLRTSGLGISSDTYLYLYEADATTLLASSDDYNGSLTSHITWVAPASENYYLLVKHWNPNVGGCGSTYTVSLNHYPLYLPVIGW